ncbi:hypothetical protein CP532_0098 [Ophiocordyceps camponoti-leonardi (nom. inval.)]|nr:hypothetical protein CP532_0098 [Ophiocordyceps camponoti-leonardi (nom. inval.)]
MMRRRKRQTLLYLLSTLLALVFFCAYMGDQIPYKPYRFATARKRCAFDASHLDDIRRRYSLDDRFHYSQQTVLFRPTPGLDRKTLTVLPQPLLASTTTSDAVTLDATENRHESFDCPEPIRVDVPVSGLPSTVDASDFIFAVSTTYQRLNDSRSDIVGDWQYWLTNGHRSSNGAKLLLVLWKATDEELADARTTLTEAGINAEVDRSDNEHMPVRYIHLVPHLYRLAQSPPRKWLVLCDDDTFFPAMHSLVRRFASFDPSREHYIGTLSEDVEAVERHGSQAFGGAGIFLSMPTAKRITEHIASCSSDEKLNEAGWQGDKLLRNCIYQNTDALLVLQPDLWQLDIRGDPAGFYEWGQKPLSLHHYRGDWNKARPAQFSKIAHVCGEDCILQRLQTADNFIISGHSIALYPAGITFDTSQVERTFEPVVDKGWNYDFVFGPQRPSLKKTGHKISWELQGSDVQTDGSVLQTYVRKRDEVRWKGVGDLPMGELDSVIELIWRPSF